jgi:hypothetical protein
MNLGPTELLIILLLLVVPVGVTVAIVLLVRNMGPKFGAPLPMGAQQGTDGWAPDPTGRHQLRWQRSGVWSAQVSDDGVVSDDPLT